MLAAAASFASASLIKSSRDLMTYVPHEIHPWEMLGVVVVALAALAAAAWYVTGDAVTAGPGYVASQWAPPAGGGSLAFGLLLAALAFRWVTVLLCIAAGGGGGVFTSLATNGLLIGTATASLIGLDNPTLLALVGMGAFLGAGYRIPLAGV
jgi:chloride channel protein, CIC family